MVLEKRWIVFKTEASKGDRHDHRSEGTTDALRFSLAARAEDSEIVMGLLLDAILRVDAETFQRVAPGVASLFWSGDRRKTFRSPKSAD
jgi:hypothetical protein